MASLRNSARFLGLKATSGSLLTPQRNTELLKASRLLGVLSSKSLEFSRSYASEERTRGTFLSKLLGQSVSPHTAAHSKVLTESRALYELQCK